MNSALCERTAVVSANGLTKNYRAGKHVIAAVCNVCLQLYKGQVVVLMGPSGSGKSTLLNLIGALDAPSSGEIYVDGIPFHSLSEEAITRHRRQKIGFIFQSYNLVPNLSALENVELPLEFTGMKSAQRRQRAQTCLTLAELPAARFHHRPAQLSGGEQQRVAIARALANNPPVILADEPTGSLDSDTSTQIMMLLQRLAHEEEKTVIIVTHDTDIAGYADVVLHLRDGVLETSA